MPLERIDMIFYSDSFKHLSPTDLLDLHHAIDIYDYATVEKFLKIRDADYIRHVIIK